MTKLYLAFHVMYMYMFLQVGSRSIGLTWADDLEVKCFVVRAVKNSEALHTSRTKFGVVPTTQRPSNSVSDVKLTRGYGCDSFIARCLGSGLYTKPLSNVDNKGD